MLDHFKEKLPASGVGDPAPVPIRAPFRALAWVLGPFLLGFPPLLLACLAWRIVTGQEPVSSIPLALAVTLPVIPPGLKILRAARTGLDPASEDRAIEAAESRAFLAVVERQDESSPR